MHFPIRTRNQQFRKRILQHCETRQFSKIWLICLEKNLGSLIFLKIWPQTLTLDEKVPVKFWKSSVFGLRIRTLDLVQICLGGGLGSLSVVIDDNFISQNGRRSLRNPGNGRQAESETARIGKRPSASSAHQELPWTRPERQEQQLVHRPWTLHGASQDFPTGSARRLLLRRHLSNAGETATCFHLRSLCTECSLLFECFTNYSIISVCL